MESPDTFFETVTTEELYNQDVLIQKSLDIFLDRLRSLHGNFQESDILGGPIITELANTMATTSRRLCYHVTNNEESRDRILENFGVVLLACINLDANGDRFGRKSDEVKSNLQIETLRILASAEILQSIQTRDLKELIYFCTSGKLSEYLVDDYLEAFSDRIKNLNNTLYQQILNNNFADKIDTIHRIKFDEHRIPGQYYQRYLELDECCQAEFWKWISLKYFTKINNPAYMFFKTYQDVVIDSGLPFNRMIKRRQAIESKSSSSKLISSVASGKSYVLDEELQDREFELRSYNKKNYGTTGSNNLTVDNHHLFFPRSQYSHDRHLHEFINSKENRVNIIKGNHREMNRFFETGEMRSYSPPRLNRELIAQINRFREIYDNDYKNYVGLQIAVLKVVQEFQNEKIGLLALDIYDLLRLQSSFVTFRTVKP